MPNISLRAKFSIYISAIVVGLLLVTAGMIIFTKKGELTSDVYRGARSYARLSAEPIVDTFVTYRESGYGANIPRFISEMKRKNIDVKKISIASASGEIVYTSEDDEKYVGDPRMIDDPVLLNRVQQVHATYITTGGEVGDLDADLEMAEGEKENLNIQIQNVVQPYIDELGNHPYSLIYDITYDNMNRRLLATAKPVGVGVLLGLIISVLVSILMAMAITGPLERLKQGALRVAKGDLESKIKVESGDEIGTLAETFNTMATELKDFQEELVKKEHVAHELAIATEMQMEIIPKEMPEIPGMRFAATVIPAEDVGGDIYDFIPMDEGKLMFYIGDVTGHGVRSGTVVSIANALIHGYAHMFKETKKSLVHTNTVLKAKTRPNMFLTMVMCQWDAAARKLSYTQAGHDQIIHYKAKNGEVVLTEKGGMALGMMPDISQIAKDFELTPEVGDYLILYTDGVPEAWSESKELYGMDRFLEVVGKVCTEKADPQAVLDALLEDVHKHMGSATQEDDITMVIAQVTE